MNAIAQSPKIPEWGLPPRGPFTVAWGARAIFNPQPYREPKIIRGRKPKPYPIPNEIDLLWDRQDMVGGTKEEREAFVAILNEKALPLLREAVHKARFDRATDEAVTVEIDGLVIVANPRASHGYLYIGAWK